ncbi:hypothetical protein ACOME3_006022 [Neoechinorhynchus agilis]
MVDNETYLPSYKELEFPTLNVTSAVLRAGAHLMALKCDEVFKEFMLCRQELDGRFCLKEGKDVSQCAMDFFKSVRNNCNESFVDYWKCLDNSPDGEFNYLYCKKTQKQFELCASEKLKLDRPPVGYFNMIRVHKTKREKPKVGEFMFPFKELDEPPLLENQERFKNAKIEAEKGRRVFWK